MEIKFQFKGRVFSICIGWGTDWFSQLYFITIDEEFIDKNSKEVIFAKSLFAWYKKSNRKFRFVVAQPLRPFRKHCTLLQLMKNLLIRIQKK